MSTRKLTIKNVTVGPRHDPYSREILEMRIGDRAVRFVTCALAMDSWVEIQRGRGPVQRLHCVDADERFREECGLTPRQFRRAHARIHAEPDRCPSCRRRLSYSTGYVGERIAYCASDDCSASFSWEEEVTDAMIA